MLGFDDRVAAVGIATQFQDRAKDVLKESAEATEAAKMQVLEP